MRPSVPHVDVLGVHVARLTSVEALDEIRKLIDAPDPATVAFANAHTINLAISDDRFASVLASADLVLNDGSGLAIAARWQGTDFPENLNGTDFTPRLLALAAAEGRRAYLLGGRPGVAERAAAALSGSIPGLSVVGTRHGYLDPAGDRRWADVADEIRALAPDIVVVAMGNPLQELWMSEHLGRTGARLGIGVGAFLDFVAGEAQRAPAWMQRTGIEWMWRLGQEPRRMFKRYVLGNPLFLLRVARRRLLGRSDGQDRLARADSATRSRR